MAKQNNGTKDLNSKGQLKQASFSLNGLIQESSADQNVADKEVDTQNQLKVSQELVKHTNVHTTAKSMLSAFRLTVLFTFLSPYLSSVSFEGVSLASEWILVLGLAAMSMSAAVYGKLKEVSKTSLTDFVSAGIDVVLALVALFFKFSGFSLGSGTLSFLPGSFTDDQHIGNLLIGVTLVQIVYMIYASYKKTNGFEEAVNFLNKIKLSSESEIPKVGDTAGRNDLSDRTTVYIDSATLGLASLLALVSVIGQATGENLLTPAIIVGSVKTVLSDYNGWIQSLNVLGGFGIVGLSSVTTPSATGGLSIQSVALSALKTVHPIFLIYQPIFNKYFANDSFVKADGTVNVQQSLFFYFFLLGVPAAFLGISIYNWKKSTSSPSTPVSESEEKKEEVIHNSSTPVVVTSANEPVDVSTTTTKEEEEKKVEGLFPKRVVSLAHVFAITPLLFLLAGLSYFDSKDGNFEVFTQFNLSLYEVFLASVCVAGIATHLGLGIYKVSKGMAGKIGTNVFHFTLFSLILVYLSNVIPSEYTDYLVYMNSRIVLPCLGLGLMSLGIHGFSLYRLSSASSSPIDDLRLLTLKMVKESSKYPYTLNSLKFSNNQ